MASRLVPSWPERSSIMFLKRKLKRTNATRKEEWYGRLGFDCKFLSMDLP